MKLFEDEHILTSTEDNVITLTTPRIRSTNSYTWGQQSTTSIMLEHISSIQTNYISYPVLLVFAVLCAVVAFIMGFQYSTQQMMALPLVILVVFVIAYFSSRKHICVIASDGGAKIAFATDSMKKEALTNFIDKIESAKFKRFDYDKRGV